MSEENNEGKKVIVPANFTHTIEPMSMMVFDDATSRLRSYVVSFEVEIQPSINYDYDSVERMIKFLSNLHGAVLISTVSSHNPYFTTGVFNNATIEIPLTEFNLYEVSTFLYYKAQALLAETSDIVGFKVFQSAPKQINFGVNIPEVKDVNPFVDESAWVEQLNLVPNEDGEYEEITDSEDYIPEPWWNRNDGQIRDFFHGIDPEVNNVISFNIDIGEYSEEELLQMSSEEAEKLKDISDTVKNGESIDEYVDQYEDDENDDDDDNDDDNGPSVVTFT